MLTVYEKGAIREYAKVTKRMANNVLLEDVSSSNLEKPIETLLDMLSEYQRYLLGVKCRITR